MPETCSETDVSDWNRQNVDENSRDVSPEAQNTERVPSTPQLTAVEKGKEKQVEPKFEIADNRKDWVVYQCYHNHDLWDVPYDKDVGQSKKS